MLSTLLTEETLSFRILILAFSIFDFSMSVCGGTNDYIGDVSVLFYASAISRHVNLLNFDIKF